MGLMLGWLIVVALLTLAAIEIGRYLRAQGNPDEFPYPRRRLSRRIAISIIFSAIMILVLYWPRTGPGMQLALMSGLLLGLAVGFVLLWRDLRETSQAAVDHATALSRQTGDALKRVFEHKDDGGEERKPNRPAP